jgi:hypothetical protein
MERTLSVATGVRDWLVQEELLLRPEAVYRLLDTVRQNGWRLRLKRGELITITAARGDVVVRETGTSVREVASAIFESTVFRERAPVEEGVAAAW